MTDDPITSINRMSKRCEVWLLHRSWAGSERLLPLKAYFFCVYVFGETPFFNVASKTESKCASPIELGWKCKQLRRISPNLGTQHRNSLHSEISHTCS